MILLKILIVIILSYLLLLWLLPMGNPIYEGLRLPWWLIRMETIKRGSHLKTKYDYGDHARQYLLLYRPVDKVTTKKHAVIYMHGGGWQFGRPEMFLPNAQILIDRGYFVFMPTHRRIPFFNITHIRQDLVAAMKKVNEVMQEEGIADYKILLGGMSSGANLAGLLTFDYRLLEEAGWSREKLAGSFLLGPPINVSGMWNSPPLYFLAGKRSGERFSLANPIDHLKPDEELPILLLQAEKDGLVEFDSVVKFHQKANELGFKNIEFHTLPDMMHMDAASWCFEHHPSHKIVLNWLEKMEAKA